MIFAFMKHSFFPGPEYRIKYSVNKKQSIRVNDHVFIVHIFQDQTQLFVDVIIPFAVLKIIKAQKLFNIFQVNQRI